MRLLAIQKKFDITTEGKSHATHAPPKQSPLFFRGFCDCVIALDACDAFGISTSGCIDTKMGCKSI